MIWGIHYFITKLMSSQGVPLIERNVLYVTLPLPIAKNDIALTACETFMAKRLFYNTLQYALQ